jgi:uncharacterized protein (TIGR01319 family)
VGRVKALLIDVGSTFTKLLVIDAQTGEFLGRSESGTTIEDDVARGVDNAMDTLPPGLRGPFAWSEASSSAAGGLRIISVGLTSALSGKAGKLASLGAGGKVVLELAGLLDASDLLLVDQARAHLVVLSGGTDGGNASALLHNAAALSSVVGLPAVIIAGNDAAGAQAAKLLEGSTDEVQIVENVFPQPGALEIGPTREMVRELFMRHITRAKGLDGLMRSLGAECEPTPLAVSRGLGVVAQLHSPAVLVDVGGATTDVHSSGGRQFGKTAADLPLPDLMRTVEGDMGMRAGAAGIVDSIGLETRKGLDKMLRCDLRVEAERRAVDPGFVPTNTIDAQVDRALATAAVRAALERHVGRLVVRDNPWGRRYRVQGKDLRQTRLVIPTGGVFRHLELPEAIVNDALREASGDLLPKNPAVCLDRDYAMFAIGLVGRRDPELALRLADEVLDLPDAAPEAAVSGADRSAR